ncbi:hypothetical protein ES708_14779 [subsurface metagenome]
MAWLAGWDKRIELKIEEYAGDIGAEVVWFPATVFLTSSQCEEVFVELTTDAEYLKVAFTKADGETELYGECELFDVSEKLGIYHVSRDGWVINANTSIFLYYDSTHADNDTYIGAITARTEVWDGNFKLVYHMVDDNGNVDDSTSNNNDGAKTGAGEPAEIAGKIGQGQSFDGTDDLITPTLDPTTELGNLVTLEAVVYADTLSNFRGVMADYVSDAGMKGFQYEGGPMGFAYSHGTGLSENNNLTISTTTWTHIAGVVKGEADGYIKVYKDGVEQGEQVDVTAAIVHRGTFFIGKSYPEINRFWDGIIDELRVSNTNRSGAWLLGTKNTLWDTLFTYGDEETEAVAVNAIFFGANF